MSQQPEITTIVADIGNSGIKLACLRDELSYLIPLDTIPAESPIAFTFSETSLDWFICSVSPSQTARLQNWITQNRPTDSQHLLSYRDIPLEICLETPDKVGVDRLVAATAASHIADRKDVVVIDAGTAVTIDAVSDGKFLGGTIFPGCETAFESLRRNAEQLPLIEKYHLPEKIIGKSTSEAIQSGVIYGQIGAIRYIAESMARQLEDPAFIITGGGIQPFLSELPPDWKFVVGLVLDGVRRIAREQRRKG